MTRALCDQPEVSVPESLDTLATVRVSTGRSPVPDMTLPTPLTREAAPRADTPKTVAPMIRLSYMLTGPELRMSRPMPGRETMFP